MFKLGFIPLTKAAGVVLVLLIAQACTLRSGKAEGWCNQPLRSGFRELQEIKVSGDWFKVYKAGKNVYAIVEPYNYQEVISYLIVGKNRNILFDTGMGMGSIAHVVNKISANPTIVINSHTHYDHIGGNYQFDSVYSVDTAYTKHFAEAGWTHDQVRQEVKPDALCLGKLPELDTSTYAIKPFQKSIKRYIKAGEVIDLGDTKIEILQTPGHTPDGISLLDRTNGYLFTGDAYYEATIWLFFEGTDLNAYEKTVKRFALLAPELKSVFPAHNTTPANPMHLLNLEAAFQSIKRGTAHEITTDQHAHPEDTVAARFGFDVFSFLISKEELKKFREVKN
jgi:glyoxylase-like metal-dependent hydrolase (beta-lactamase superfamily II)